MTIHLPKPYPDELLYSVVVRYMTYAGRIQITTFLEDLLGGYPRLNPFLPRGLTIVSRRTWSIWHMSGEDIARRLTMYPYYAAFIAPTRTEQLLNCLLSATPSEFARYLITDGIPHSLRYCEKCKRADFAEYGETYWRRCHQMKGVAVCPRHGEGLLEMPLPDTGTLHIISPPTETTGPARTPLLDIDMYEKKQLLTIARRCRRMLEERIESQWYHADASLYRAVAMSKGFCDERNGCHHREIVRKFYEIYSDRVIKTFGFREGTNIEDWVLKIFSVGSNRHSFRPVEHAVIQEFLSKVTEYSANSMLIGPGPWKCPNPLTQHQSLFPIKRVKITRVSAQHVLAHTTCCCGYGFEFYETYPTDRSMPIVSRVTAYGPSWEEEIKRLNGAGMDIYKIASALKIPPTAVRRILKSPAEGPLTAVRRQWLDALNETESHTVLEARRQHPALYQQIQRSDPNFLTCNSRRGRHHPTSKKSWLQKDRMLSVKLARAAELVLNEVPPTRASVRAILRRSGTSRWIIRRELKEWRRVLREMCETGEEFQKRRLKYLADMAKAQGRKPERYQFFREGRITNKKYQERLETYVDSLCR